MRATALIRVHLSRLARSGESGVGLRAMSPSQLRGSVMVLNLVRALMSPKPVSRELTPAGTSAHTPTSRPSDFISSRQD